MEKLINRYVFCYHQVCPVTLERNKMKLKIVYANNIVEATQKSEIHIDFIQWVEKPLQAFNAIRERYEISYFDKNLYFTLIPSLL